MIEKKRISPDNEENQMLANATTGAVLLTSAGLLFVVVGFFIAEINSWKDYILLGAPAVLFVLGLVSIVLLRRGQIRLGTSIIFIANLILPIVETLLQTGIGWVVFVYTLVSSALLIWRSLPTRSRRWAMPLTAIALLFIVIIELVNPSIRISPAKELVAFVLIVTGLLVVAFMVVAVQKAWSGHIRARLLASFIMLAAVPVLLTGVISISITSQNTRAQVLEEVTAIAQLRANQVKDWTSNLQVSLGTVMQDETTLGRSEQVIRNTPLADLSKLGLRRKFDEWKESTKYFDEMFIVDPNGVILVSTNSSQEGKIVKNQTYFEEGMKAPYVTPPSYDVALSAYSILFTRPIQDRGGKVLGVIAGRANLGVVNRIMTDEIGLGDTNETYLVGANSALLTTSRLRDAEIGKTYIRTTGVADILDSRTKGASAYDDYRQVPVFGAQLWIPELQVAVIAEQDANEALRGLNQQLATTIALMILTMAVAGFVAFLVTRTIADPITHLVTAAENITAGDLEVVAPVQRADEIGTLSEAFNTMTRQLRETLQGLEQRVTARTKDLEIVAEVGTATATILESKRLLQEVVDLTRERFNLYHSHIYLLDEKGENLVLTAGAGEPGRVMVTEGRSIPLDREQSLVARAARERKGVTVNDVTEAPDFLPNPLLPDTRSELAVPMIVGGSVIGVFDIQSEHVGRFTESDVNIQTTLAAQLATSIQNVRSFEQSRKQAELQSLVNMIGSRIQRTTSIEETLQTAIRELGMAVGASRVKVNISTKTDRSN